MVTIKELKTKLAKKINQAPIEFKAVLGRADGTVIAGAFLAYVTLRNGNVITVHNDKVASKPYRKIILGYDSEYPDLLQVLRFDNVYDTRPEPNLPNHKDSHSWHGYDPVEISKEQILELLPRAAGGMVVRVYGGEIFVNNIYRMFNTNDIDMSAEIPGSGAEWVNAEVDDTGVVTFNHGSNFGSRELLDPSNRPSTASDKKLLYSVKMYAGLVDFIQTRTDTDIFDPRFVGIGSAGGGSSFPRYIFTTDPTVTDDIDAGYLQVDFWLNEVSGELFYLADNSAGAAVWIPLGSAAGSDVIFRIDGALVVTTDADVKWLITKNTHIESWYIYADDQGSASSIIADIHLNGTTIFTNQANRPTLAYNDGNGWAVSGTPDFVDFVAGDVLSLDLDQIATGSGRLRVIGLVDSSSAAPAQTFESVSLASDQSVTSIADLTGMSITKTLIDGVKYRWKFEFQGGKTSTGNLVVQITDVSNNSKQKLERSVTGAFADHAVLTWEETGTGASVTRKVRASCNVGSFNFDTASDQDIRFSVERCG